METFKDLPVLGFQTAAAWRLWLELHHSEAHGLWLRIYKKGSGISTVTYAEALDEALCFGWIDSTKNGYDADSFLQRFSPRKARSMWSTVNREHVARLIEAGKMQEAGHRAIEEAKRNGAWEAAYAPQSQMPVPEDFQAELDRHPEALAVFLSLSSANRYTFLFRLHQAKKPETRARRIAMALERLSRGEALP